MILERVRQPAHLVENDRVMAWLRRIIVSIGIGGTSYAIMLGIMVLSIVYDRELEPPHCVRV